MSGFFGQLISSLSGSEKDNAAPVADSLHEVLGLNGPGGISGLLDQFSSSGLGEHVQSWIGAGKNLPMSAEDVSNVLSNDQVQSLVQKTGLPVQDLMPLVAKLLPHAVDQATPDGQIASVSDENS